MWHVREFEVMFLFNLSLVFLLSCFGLFSVFCSDAEELVMPSGTTGRVAPVDEGKNNEVRCFVSADGKKAVTREKESVNLECREKTGDGEHRSKAGKELGEMGYDVGWEHGWNCHRRVWELGEKGVGTWMKRVETVKERVGN